MTSGTPPAKCKRLLERMGVSIFPLRRIILLSRDSCAGKRAGRTQSATKASARSWTQNLAGLEIRRTDWTLRQRSALARSAPWRLCLAPARSRCSGIGHLIEMQMTDAQLLSLAWAFHPSGIRRTCPLQTIQRGLWRSRSSSRVLNLRGGVLHAGQPARRGRGSRVRSTTERASSWAP